MFQTKRMAGYLFALLAVVQAASFFIYYQATENIDAKWAVFPAYWLRSIADAAVPVLIAAAMLLLLRAGHKRLWLFPILPVLSLSLYYLPDHYLYYLSDGLTTLEAIGSALVVMALECTLIYLLVLLLFFIAKTVFHRLTKAKEPIKENEDYPIFDLNDPFIKSVFFIPFVYFYLQIVMEIVDTVIFIVSGSGNYTLEEILTIVFSFLMHFAVLLLTHIFAVLYIRYADRHYRKADED